jgi:hypothetical protein
MAAAEPNHSWKEGLHVELLQEHSDEAISQEIFSILPRMDCSSNLPPVVSGSLADPSTCSNCGASDLWFAEQSTGDIVCGGCGLCDHVIAIHQLSRNEREREGNARDENFQYLASNTIPHSTDIQQGSIKSKRSRSAPYKRTTYFTERLNQWLMCEPDIPDNDWAEIEYGFRDFCIERGLAVKIPTPAELRASKGKQIEGTVRLTKDEIRIILVSRDAVKDTEYEDAIEEVSRGQLRQKYLEKWLTIRWRLCGKASDVDEVPAWVISEMKIMFEELQEAFRQAVFSNDSRKSFPCYNTAISRMLDLLNQSHVCNDFPILKTRRAWNKNNFYWRKMIKYLQWPYINSDEEILQSQKKRRINNE